MLSRMLSKQESEVSSFKKMNLFLLSQTVSTSSCNTAIIASRLKAIIAQHNFQYCQTLN